MIYFYKYNFLDQVKSMAELKCYLESRPDYLAPNTNIEPIYVFKERKTKRSVYLGHGYLRKNEHMPVSEFIKWKEYVHALWDLGRLAGFVDLTV